MAESLMVASERVPLSDEQIAALVSEFDAACLILDWRKSRRTTRDVAHKAFRDLVVTIRAIAKDLGTAIDEARVNEAQWSLAVRRALDAEKDLLAVAKLAADTPQFFNPLEAFAAQAIRDRVLADAGKGPPLSVLASPHPKSSET